MSNSSAVKLAKPYIRIKPYTLCVYMAKTMFRILLALSLVIFIANEAEGTGCYRAAVLDHVYQSKYEKNKERNIEVNLKVFDRATAIAKKDVSLFGQTV